MTRAPSMLRLCAEANFTVRLANAVGTVTPGEDDDPDAVRISDWLSRLLLLEGVPLRYLAPDPGMLPPESIRFFICDDNWLTALVDGAFSIGASSVGVTQKSNSQIVQKFRERAHRRLTRQRRAKLRLPAKTEPETLDFAGFDGRLSGFILRSSLMATWPTMEVKGYTDADAKTEATLLRFDVLVPGIALALFAGQVETVIFAEPADMLHFGVSEGGAAKGLRYVDPYDGHKTGDQVLDDHAKPVEVAVPYRDGDRGVIRVADLAGVVLQGLKTNHAISSSPFTAAQFALELVQGSQEVEFSTKA
jgi:hypothetical protein